MRHLLVILVGLFLSLNGFSQEDSTATLSNGKQQQYLKAVKRRASSLDEKITAKTRKTLARLQAAENKLYNKLFKKDSIAAKRLFGGSADAYDQLSAKLDVERKHLTEYLPGYDTLMNSLRFLEKHGIDADNLKLMEGSTIAVKNLGSRLQVTNEIKIKLKERKQYLQEQFGALGMAKQLKRLNKEMYYYQEQLKEYKALLADKSKIEKHAIALLRSNAAFKTFMEKNSILSQVFSLPESYLNTGASFTGMQMRASVQALVNERFGSGGIDVQQYVQEQVQNANAALSVLKTKINNVHTVSSADIEMPQGFKPNTQKTKSFLKRIEYGANIQTQKMHSFLPVTSDIAVTAGYKLNDKSVAGVGAAYKMGWGQGLDKIRISHEGVSLRSFIDYKIKGSFWLTGGYEQHYYQTFTRIEQINDAGGWKQSALLGLSKKMKIGNKSSKVQLLYDFFNRQNGLRTQPLVVRIGYQFN